RYHEKRAIREEAHRAHFIVAAGVEVRCVRSAGVEEDRAEVGEVFVQRAEPDDGAVRGPVPLLVTPGTEDEEPVGADVDVFDVVEGVFFPQWLVQGPPRQTKERPGRHQILRGSADENVHTPSTQRLAARDHLLARGATRVDWSLD